MIRVATPNDAKAILDIYSPYIEKTTCNYEIETPTTEQFAERIRSYLIEWPWLVDEEDGIITGYAYGSKYRERAGYKWCVEVSVYMADTHMRSGIASSLYQSLFRILKAQHYRNVYAVINLPNERSVRFHESNGFSWFATYNNVGYKLGRWTDVGWWQLQVNDYSIPPEEPIPFSQLDKTHIDKLLGDI